MHNLLMKAPGEKLVFRGGKWGSVVPLAIFLLFTLALVVMGAPKEEGMIIGAMVGLSLGMLFVTNVAAYSERIFGLMANQMTANMLSAVSAKPELLRPAQCERPESSAGAAQARWSVRGGRSLIPHHFHRYLNMFFSTRVENDTDGWNV